MDGGGRTGGFGLSEDESPTSSPSDRHLNLNWHRVDFQSRSSLPKQVVRVRQIQFP